MATYSVAMALIHCILCFKIFLVQFQHLYRGVHLTESWFKRSLYFKTKMETNFIYLFIQLDTINSITNNRHRVDQIEESEAAI